MATFATPDSHAQQFQQVSDFIKASPFKFAQSLPTDTLFAPSDEPISEVTITRDPQMRLRDVQARDGQGQPVDLAFNYVATAQTRSAGAAYTAGTQAQMSVNVSWIGASFSGRMHLPGSNVEFAVSGDAAEQSVDLTVSLNDQVFKGQVHPDDAEAAPLAQLRGAVQKMLAEHGPLKAPTLHPELFAPLFEDVRRMSLAQRAGPGAISIGDRLLCTAGAVGAFIVFGGIGGIIYGGLCLSAANL